MSNSIKAMPIRKRVALVAHDSQKPIMVNWANQHCDILSQHQLWGTGTTGQYIIEKTNLSITLLKSGPLGGDQQIGAMIADRRLDILFFFTDPLAALPHDVDVKALLRLSTLYQIAIACNKTTADFVLQSTLLNERYTSESYKNV